MVNNCLNCKFCKDIYRLDNLLFICEKENATQIKRNCISYQEGDELFLLKSDSNEYISYLTKEMDEYVNYSSDYLRTYIFLTNKDVEDVKLFKKNKLAIRFPGATIGHVEVSKDLTIKEITLYEDMSFEPYTKDVKEIFEKFIGKKIRIITF